MTIPDLAENASAPAVDDWLRRALGRQLQLLPLAPLDAGEDARLAALLAALRRCAEIRLVGAATQEPSEGASRVSDEDLLRAGLRADVDIVLVWAPEGALPAASGAQGGEPAWYRGVLTRIEDVGLRDRAFVALVGPAVTRVAARALGYEDGFTDVPTAALVVALAREAVRREEYLRRGSSPPCYL